MKTLKVLIDGDMFAFAACSSAEREIDWGNGIWTLHSDIEEAKGIFEDKVAVALHTAFESMKFSGNYEVVFCFSDTSNFRKLINPMYKANRVGKRKPLAYFGLVEWVKNNFSFTQLPNLEADDCIGITATRDPKNTLIISGDKDMLSVMGHHYDYIRDIYQYIDESTANLNFFIQALAGDTTDGYGGCPSYGVKTAQKVLDGIDPMDDKAMWNKVVECYKKKSLSEEEALVQARCARILRHTDYKKGQVVLWQPSA